MKNNFIHITLALILAALLLLLTDPFMLWMPPMLAMTALLVVVVILCVWAGFVMKEQLGDEREGIHRLQAGRVAYLSGVAALTLALIVQGLMHQVDPWISLTLIIMVVSKLGTRLYYDTYH